MGKQFTDFQTKTANPEISEVTDVHPEELVKVQDQVHLIDVRRPDEYEGELGHIPGAKLLTLDTLPQEIGNLPKDETIVFVCRSGARSARASAFAKENGLQNTFNMLGGMILWNDLGFETEGKS